MKGAKARSSELQKALDEINKGGPVVGSLAEMVTDVEAIPTGNLALDWVTTIGGFPRGRIVEAYGPPSSGKTSAAMQVASRAQGLGETVLYLDYEQSFDPEYAEALGLDPKSPLFLIEQPTTFEEGMNHLRKLMSTGAIAVCIVDSVAAMVLEKELANETGDMSVSARDKARYMAQLMRQLAAETKQTGTCVIFINHIQDVIESGFAAAKGIQRKTTPGGTALKYFAALRLEFKQVGNKRGARFNPVTGKEEDVIIYTKVEAFVSKSKVGSPFRKAVMRVYFGEGFSQAWQALDILSSAGIIKLEGGGKYTFTEETAPPWMDLHKKAWLKGEDATAEKIAADPAWTAKLVGRASEYLKQHEIQIKAEIPNGEVSSEDVEALLVD